MKRIGAEFIQNKISMMTRTQQLEFWHESSVQLKSRITMDSETTYQQANPSINTVNEDTPTIKDFSSQLPPPREEKGQK